MYEFTPFKKSDKLQFSSFIQFPRELLEREEYKILNPNAMLLFSVLADRLDLSFKQVDKNSKVKFYDDKGNMYVIFKREEIQEKLHLKRSALDTALNLLKDCNLIQEKKQGKNLPNIIYVGKTIGMIEDEKIIKFRDVQNQHSGKNEINSPECMKSTPHNNYNNINKNNIYNSGYSKKSNRCKSSTFGNIEEYKKRNGIEDFNCLYANKFN